MDGTLKDIDSRGWRNRLIGAFIAQQVIFALICVLFSGDAVYPPRMYPILLIPFIMLPECCASAPCLRRSGRSAPVGCRLYLLNNLLLLGLLDPDFQPFRF